MDQTTCQYICCQWDGRNHAQSNYQIEYVVIHTTTFAHDKVVRQFLQVFDDSISPVIEEPIVRTVSMMSILRFYKEWFLKKSRNGVQNDG